MRPTRGRSSGRRAPGCRDARIAPGTPQPRRGSPASERRAATPAPLRPIRGPAGSRVSLVLRWWPSTTSWRLFRCARKIPQAEGATTGKTLRDEDSLAREGGVGTCRGEAVSAAVTDLDRGQLPDRTLPLGNRSGEHRVSRRVSGAGGPDRRIAGRRARNGDGEGEALHGPGVAAIGAVGDLYGEHRLELTRVVG